MIDKLIQDAKAANDVLSLKRVLVAALGEMQKSSKPAPAPKPSAKKKDSGKVSPPSHKSGY